MRDDVESDLLGEIHRLQRVAHEDRAALLEQLVHPVLARAGNGLVGRDHHALDRCRIVQRLERHHKLRGRTVGVGDDIALGIAVDRLGVHLGHDQRHVGVHAIQRGIVDHHAARRRSLGRIVPGRTAARRE